MWQAAINYWPLIAGAAAAAHWALLDAVGAGRSALSSPGRGASR